MCSRIIYGTIWSGYINKCKIDAVVFVQPVDVLANIL